jgi:protein-S-isoprenylcysteine O-methyltransferase Ste14
MDDIGAASRPGADLDLWPASALRRLTQMKRITIFIYGVISYAIFFATFLYAIGFIGNFLTPTRLDAPARQSAQVAIAIDLALLAIFAVQHSVMARPWFKKMWTRIIPEAAERSTYVLLSSVLLIALFALWRPIGGVVWQVNNIAGRATILVLYAAGWAILLASTFLINHFDLFGLRQVWLNLRGQDYTSLKFRTPGLYRLVRHPLYVGWLLIFWMTPMMTAAHLLFAVMTTAYILVAIRFEERDLVTFHGAEYEAYRQRVPMLVPFSKSAPEGVANEQPVV